MAVINHIMGAQIPFSVIQYLHQQRYIPPPAYPRCIPSAPFTEASFESFPSTNTTIDTAQFS